MPRTVGMGLALPPLHETSRLLMPDLWRGWPTPDTQAAPPCGLNLESAKMSKPLVVTIPHRLGKEAATARLKSGLAKATATLPMMSLDEEIWTGDAMAFRMSAMGQQAQGTVNVADENVRIEITLPWLLASFGESIASAIREKGKVLLEHKA